MRMNNISANGPVLGKKSEFHLCSLGLVLGCGRKPPEPLRNPSHRERGANAQTPPRASFLLGGNGGRANHRFCLFAPVCLAQPRASLTFGPFTEEPRRSSPRSFSQAAVAA